MATHIFGIRHHGPGSARSLHHALEALGPDCVLVEGPPDAEAVLPLLAHTEMKPPVALLVYVPDEPSRSVYYPFATYSPEWQAIDFALRRNIPVRFMDLPQYHRLALPDAAEAQSTQPESALEKSPAVPKGPTAEPLPPLPEGEQAQGEPAEPEEVPLPEEALAVRVRQDPLNWIAEAAGYSDGESWWEHMVEQRRSSADLFQGVMEVMTALREAAPPDPDPVEAQREAWMRQTIRAAQKEGFERIAVVCGAWHGPALMEIGPAKDDTERLKGLPKAKVAATWVPWTYGRLTYASGYGAGVTSPAWYEHLWYYPDRVIAHWMTSAAKLFREEDLPASPASVIEAVRLAEALAAVRDRPLPGLPELWEAAQSIFCFGSAVPMQLIQEKLIIGEKLGQVPEETPMLPIQQDLRKEQKRLRLPAEAAYSDKDFDLRSPTDLERSVLLHRLNLLSIPWGQLQRTGGGKGTFHELWRLQWQPEFEVKLIEANVYGNSVRAAASRSVCEQADKIEALAELTALVNPVMNADLPEAVQRLMVRLESLAAVTSDVPHLMDALPALANVLRYGNVRQTDVRMVTHVVDGLVARICIGLPAACAALNDEAAEAMYPRLMGVHGAVRLLQKEEHQAAWNATLERLADLSGLHGLIAGRCCRLLLDQQIWEAEEVGRRLNLALSRANDPAQAAAWIEGLLKDSGEVLVHTDALWPILDRWVALLPADVFVQLLPLLRRTFSTFSPPLRRQLGERARGGAGRTRTHSTLETDLDRERAERVLPLMAQLLGLTYERGTE
jgi:hypothetical protein